MTNPDYVHIAVLADGTGSTGRATDPGRTRAMDFTEGIKSFIADHAAAGGKTTFSLVEFRSPAPKNGPGRRMQMNRVAWFEENPDLSGWSIRPYGSTPLLDALGTEITEIGAELEGMPEDQRPRKVYLLVATDGEENASAEYSKSQVNDMVAHQSGVYGWEFVFLGVGIDAFDEAGGIGVRRGSTMTVNSGSTQSIAAAYAGTSAAVLRSRGPSGQSVSYTDTERKAAG